MTAGRAPSLACACALSLWAAADPAHAQFSGSLTYSSDYRLRGLSLTEERPAISLGAAWDDASGFYAGGAVIAHDPANDGVRILGHTEYVGYAARLKDGGPAIDVGFANVDMSLYRDRKYPFGYKQVYVGVSKDAVSARVSYSPDYPRNGVDSTYVDLNAAIRPAEHWRLTGHLGAMRRWGGARATDGPVQRYDVRLGIARTFSRAEIQLAFNAITPRPNPIWRRSRTGVSVAASYFF